LESVLPGFWNLRPIVVLQVSDASYLNILAESSYKYGCNCKVFRKISSALLWKSHKLLINAPEIVHARCRPSNCRDSP